MRRFVLRALPLLLTVVGGVARAAELADCIPLDDAERLACYDRVSGRTRSPTRVPDTQPPAPPTVAAPAVGVAPDRAEALATPPIPSMLGERWALDAAPRDTRYNVVFHQPNYFIGRYSDHAGTRPSSPTHPFPEDADSTSINPGEAKFQISFKTRLWEDADRRVTLWAAYTQQSHWQVGNGALSRPFRETDYQPEFIVGLRPDLPAAGWRWRLLNLGLVHQSNGREDPLSRSWNRVYAQFGLERGEVAVLLRPWYKFHERTAGDDNPDIRHYYGSGDLVVVWKHDDQTLTFTGRANPGSGKGAAQIEWSTKWFGPLRFYVQAFSGYGESLVDYNWRQNTIGAGVSLNDAL
jgi:phospholipase A1